MQVHVELPEDVARAMSAGGQDLDCAARESIAIEGYRRGLLSEGQLRRLLGFDSWFQVHAFLKERDVHLNYTEQDLERDFETAARFGSR